MLGALRRVIALHRLAAWLVRWRTDAGPQVACANHRSSNLVCRDDPNCRFRVARQYGFRTPQHGQFDWARKSSPLFAPRVGLYSALVSASRAGRSEHPVGHGSPCIEGNSLALSEALNGLMEE